MHPFLSVDSRVRVQLKSAVSQLQRKHKIPRALFTLVFPEAREERPVASLEQLVVFLQCLMQLLFLWNRDSSDICEGNPLELPVVRVHLAHQNRGLLEVDLVVPPVKV